MDLQSLMDSVKNVLFTMMPKVNDTQQLNDDTNVILCTVYNMHLTFSNS